MWLFAVTKKSACLHRSLSSSVCLFFLKHENSLIWNYAIFLCCLSFAVFVSNLTSSFHLLSVTPETERNQSNSLSCLICHSLKPSSYLHIHTTTWKLILPRQVTSNIKVLKSLYISCCLLPIREFLVRANTTSEVSLRSPWIPLVTCGSSPAPSSLSLRYNENRMRHSSQ